MEGIRDKPDVDRVRRGKRREMEREGMKEGGREKGGKKEDGCNYFATDWQGLLSL